MIKQPNKEKDGGEARIKKTVMRALWGVTIFGLFFGLLFKFLGSFLKGEKK